MQPHNSIDLSKVNRERVEQYLTPAEAKAMRSATDGAATTAMRTLFTNVAGTIHWYILNAPLYLRGKNFGKASNMKEAEQAVNLLLNPNTRRAVV